MIPSLENAVLGTDLDCQNNDLLNVKALIPVPDNLVTIDDPALTDARPPLPGSVTDASVAPTAAIVQSKLSLDGVIPPAWLGSLSTQAAQGNLAEYVANKNQPNGYAGLDSTGKIPSARLPATVGTGTVTSVGLSMPLAFTVTGSPVTGAGSLAVAWNSVSDQSWFGNNSGGVGPPLFHTTPLPPSLIPALDASIVTTGVFNPALLPIAVGVGVGHAPGAVPTPGTGVGTLPSDYLARDMTYKTLPAVLPAYQPTIPNPVLSASPLSGGNVPVTITSSVDGAILFYSLTASSGPFVEVPSAGYVLVPSPGHIWVYAAHAGYNNSAVVTLAV